MNTLDQQILTIQSVDGLTIGYPARLLMSKCSTIDDVYSDQLKMVYDKEACKLGTIEPIGLNKPNEHMNLQFTMEEIINFISFVETEHLKPYESFTEEINGIPKKDIYIKYLVSLFSIADYLGYDNHTSLYSSEHSMAEKIMEHIIHNIPEMCLYKHYKLLLTFKKITDHKEALTLSRDNLKFTMVSIMDHVQNKDTIHVKWLDLKMLFDGSLFTDSILDQYNPMIDMLFDMFGKSGINFDDIGIDDILDTMHYDNISSDNTSLQKMSEVMEEINSGNHDYYEIYEKYKNTGLLKDDITADDFMNLCTNNANTEPDELYQFFHLPEPNLHQEVDENIYQDNM